MSHRVNVLRDDEVWERFQAIPAEKPGRFLQWVLPEEQEFQLPQASTISLGGLMVTDDGGSLERISAAGHFLFLADWNAA